VTARTDAKAQGRGSKESKKSTHNYIAEGEVKCIEAIEKSEVFEESEHYPYQFLCNLKALGPIQAN
jgi:hypothetical protein